MAEFIDFGKYNAQQAKKRATARATALEDAYSESRNVMVFDMLRKWAYSEIRNYWQTDYKQWEKACFEQIQRIWAGVSVKYDKSHPYLISEMKASAKSVAKWTWKNTTQSGFQTYVELTHLPHQQSARGKKSGIARLALSSDKREQAIELSNGGMKQKDIATMLSVGQGTISKWLAMPRTNKTDAPNIPEPISDSSLKSHKAVLAEAPNKPKASNAQCLTLLESKKS